MSKESKHRLRFTIPVPMLEALDSLVEKGIYLNRDEAVMGALEFLFREYGIAPFFQEAEEPVEQGARG